MIKEYEQYYFTWIPSMGGAAVYASSSDGNADCLKSICRSTDFDTESFEPTYKLTYCAELGSFVFLCARRMRQSLDGRMTPFVHIYQLVGRDSDAACYVAPNDFRCGTPEDLSATSLPRASFDVKPMDMEGVDVSDELITEIIYLMYFCLYRDKKRMIIRCRDVGSFEEDFRRLTSLIYGLAPKPLREKLSVSMSTARLSESCKIDIVTTNVNISSAANEAFLLDYSNGRINRADGQKLDMFELQHAVCRHLAHMVASKKFMSAADNFFANYTRLISESRSNSFAENMAAYFFLLGGEKMDISDIKAPSLIESLKMSLKFYQSWPYSTNDYERLMMDFGKKYVICGETEMGDNIVKIVYDMPFPEGCVGKDKFCARLLDSIFDEGYQALANEAFGRAYAAAPSTAEEIASHIKNTDILGRMPDELSVDTFINMCGNGITRRILFDERNKVTVINAFMKALDSGISDVELKKALDIFNSCKRTWCGELCRYILEQRPDSFSVSVFMLMCADAVSREILFDRQNKNTVFDSFFHAIYSNVPKSAISQAARKLNKFAPSWYKELCRYTFEQINDLLANHYNQCRIEELCRLCGRTTAAFDIDRNALWDTVTHSYLNDGDFNSDMLSQICSCLGFPDAKYRAAVKMKDSCGNRLTKDENPENSERADSIDLRNDKKDIYGQSINNTGISEKNAAAQEYESVDENPPEHPTDTVIKILLVLPRLLLIVLAWLAGFIFKGSAVVNRDIVSAVFAALCIAILTVVFIIKDRKPFKLSSMPEHAAHVCRLAVWIIIYMLLRAIGS